MQADFVTEFLKRCKRSNIHTAIETCAYAKWDNLKKILDYTDLVYLDIKQMDPAVHEKVTSASNAVILDNARKVSAIRPIIIRIPIVPGCNDSRDNIASTSSLAAELGDNLVRVELLPYHKYGAQTYSRIGRKYKLIEVEPPDESRMEALKDIVESFGLKAQIGG